MEDAKGIPERGKKGTIPKDRTSRWKLNVQEHKADRAGKHYDIRLNPPGSDKAYSWASRHFPGPGEKTTAVQTDVHSKDYMGFSGEIGEGYGKGKVDSLTLEDIEVLKSDDDHIKFNRYKGRDTERYIMMRKPGTDEFLFYNYTPTESSKIYEDVPKYKEKYKNVPLDKLDPQIRNDKEVWSPKLDGAHNLVVLRGDKNPDVFSYRKSRKEGDKFIDHTFRTNLYNQKVPKEFKKTILRGELYVPGKPGTETARLLNSNVWKSRETQQKEGKPLELGVFDVVKWKGKNVEDLPFQEKLPMLREVEEKIQGLKHTPWYSTEKEKETLRRQILNKENPLTEEGIAIYDLDGSTPRKSKREDDWDAEIVGIFKATPGSKYEGNAIGGFLVRPEGSHKILRVGSGLDDETRRDAHQNPEKYKGEWAKFKSHRQHASGKHQAPIFKEMRSDKFPRPFEKTATIIKKLAKDMSKTRKSLEKLSFLILPGPTTASVEDIVVDEKARRGLKAENKRIKGREYAIGSGLGAGVGGILGGILGVEEDYKNTKSTIGKSLNDLQMDHLKNKGNRYFKRFGKGGLAAGAGLGAALTALVRNKRSNDIEKANTMKVKAMSATGSSAKKKMRKRISKAVDTYDNEVPTLIGFRPQN